MQGQVFLLDTACFCLLNLITVLRCLVFGNNYHNCSYFLVQFLVITLLIWMPLAEELIWISDPSLHRVAWNLLLQLNIWCGLLCRHCIFSSLMFPYQQSEVVWLRYTLFLMLLQTSCLFYEILLIYNQRTFGAIVSGLVHRYPVLLVSIALGCLWEYNDIGGLIEIRKKQHTC